MATNLSVDDIKSVRPILSWMRSTKTKSELDRLAEYDSENDTYTLTTYLGDIPITYIYRHLSDNYYCCLEDGNFSVSRVQSSFDADERLNNEFYKRCRINEDGTPMSVESHYDSDPLNYINKNVYFLNNSSGGTDPTPTPTPTPPEKDYLPECFNGPVDPDDPDDPDDPVDPDEPDEEEVAEAKLFITSEGALVPLLSAKDSKLLDIHNYAPVPINKRILDIYLRYIGFDHIFNGRNVEGSLVCKYIDNAGILRLTWGNNTQELLGHTDAALGVISEEDFDLMYNEFDMLDNELMIAERDSTFVPKSSDVIQLCKYGDIADYVSLRTNVEVLIDGKSRVKYNKFKITSDRVPLEEHRSDIEGNEDPYLYRTVLKNYEVKRLVNSNDLLELSIAFKVNAMRSPITWYGDNLNSNDSPMSDSLMYFRYDVNTPDKLNWHGGAIRWDGYHVTKGCIMEGTYTANIVVQDSITKLGDEFLISIDDDTVNIFPLNPEVTEYYVKSCKRLVKNL